MVNHYEINARRMPEYGTLEHAKLYPNAEDEYYVDLEDIGGEVLSDAYKRTRVR